MAEARLEHIDEPTFTAAELAWANLPEEQRNAIGGMIVALDGLTEADARVAAEHAIATLRSYGGINS